MLNSRQRIREEELSIQQRKELSRTLDWSIEEMQCTLSTLTNLSIAIDRERIRLDQVALGNKVSVDEIHLLKSLLTAFWHEAERLEKVGEEIEYAVECVLSKVGVKATVPETWFKSPSRSRARTMEAADQ